MTSPTSGHISIASEEISAGGQLLPEGILRVPAGNVAMISFARFSDKVRVEVYFRYHNKSQSMFTRNKHYAIDANVYDVASVKFLWTKSTLYCFQPYCFKLVYSFHLKSETPRRLSNGLYNCSGHDYGRFRQHLDCNLKVECEDGRDESGPCPVTSPACRRWGPSSLKCFRFISKETLQSYDPQDRNVMPKVDRYCAALNDTLGQPKDVYDLSIVDSVFIKYSSRQCFRIVMGLSFGGLDVPSMYRKSVVTIDQSVLHYTVNSQRGLVSYKGEKMCLGFLRGQFDADACSDQSAIYKNHCATCEFTLVESEKEYGEKERITLPNITFAFARQRQNLSRCANGQVTHRFLADKPHYQCEEKNVSPCTSSSCSMNQRGRLYGTEKHLTSFIEFTCDDDVTRLSYTLLCDFRHDCQDESDESFCQHPPCGAFQCDNGQCVSYTKRCDMVSHCLDDSDEMSCRDYRVTRIEGQPTFQSPVLIRFDGTSLFKARSMTSTESCPITHYRCPGEYSDCLPVFTLCNGWYDCLSHEDEHNCETMICPGFYKCFNCSVCVHSDHLCDGFPHCPLRDDEWMCDMTCPAQCVCHGHAFLCPRRFSTHLFPKLRYLNAHGSGVAPHTLEGNYYIVWLALSECSLQHLPAMTVQNLKFLDLSNNYLKTVHMSVFIHLKNLQTLILSGNPIHLLDKGRDSVVQQSLLNTVDLSHTSLVVFDSSPLSSFSFIQTLNLSYSQIHTVNISGFQYTPRLTSLYMEGTAVETFPADMFQSLSYLRFVTAQIYKLCCKEILPSHADLVSCSAPTDEISSCADLLRSETYRGFLILIGILSLLGNMICLLLRVCVHKRVSASGFHVFVTNLSLADLLMGVYVAIIGVADGLLRGKYLILDREWKHSVACKMAGFLSLLSSEVSALIIWLITLDRFIVLHFPFSTVRFQRTSAAVACLFTWFVGLLLAFIPMLPMTAHWNFFSQTGICIPLPVTRQDFRGKGYSVSVFVVFNFVLFILIATGQAFIYWSVQKNALNTDKTKAWRDITIARRLISVAVTDFLCWFPIGLCGLLALGDTPISGEVSVALAIFVLPLNSALNPFMYTFNMLMEKRRKSREAILLKWLESNSDLLQC